MLIVQMMTYEFHLIRYGDPAVMEAGSAVPTHIETGKVTTQQHTTILNGESIR